MSFIRSVLFLFSLLITFSSNAQDLAPLSEKAYVYWEEAQFGKAAKTFDKMIKVKPDSAYLFTLKGFCLCMDGEEEIGFESFNRAYEMDPLDFRLFEKRARCFQRLGLRDKAVQDLTEGLVVARADSIKKVFYLNRGAIKDSYRDKRGAHADNLKALALDSADIGIHNNIGMSYAELKRYDKAEYHLKQVLARDSTLEGGLLNLGFLYLTMERNEDALDVLTLAINKFPEEGIPYNNRGLVKHKLGDSVGGIKDIERSLELYEDNSYAYRNLALIYKDIGKPTLACKNCAKAIEMGYTSRYGSDMKKLYQEICTK